MNDNVLVIFKRLGYSKSQFVIKTVKGVISAEITVTDMTVPMIADVIKNFINANNLSDCQIDYYAPPKLFAQISERLLIGTKSVLDIFQDENIEIQTSRR